MKNIFVGNLDFGATESSIRSLFEGVTDAAKASAQAAVDAARNKG